METIKCQVFPLTESHRDMQTNRVRSFLPFFVLYPFFGLDILPISLCFVLFVVVVILLLSILHWGFFLLYILLPFFLLFFFHSTGT